MHSLKPGLSMICNFVNDYSIDTVVPKCDKHSISLYRWHGLGVSCFKKEKKDFR